jgi:DNA-directed RNA polymerase specialized sigma24 family protein
MNLAKSENRISATPAATEPPTLSLTAQEVIRRAQNGDAAAFEYLYGVHSRHVYSICLQMLKNRADAEDITQQVFLRVFRKIGTFRGDSGFSTWLHLVTVNAVLMHLHRKKPKTLLDLFNYCCFVTHEFLHPHLRIVRVTTTTSVFDPRRANQTQHAKLRRS